MNSKAGKHQKSLDYLKLLLSFLIITIHWPVSNNETVNYLLSNGIARIGVPAFFIINAFFLSRTLNNVKAFCRYATHILLLFVVWSGIYYHTNSHFLSFTDFRSSLYSYSLLFNGFGHLWYLQALLLGSLALFLINQLNLNKKLLLSLAIGLFIIGWGIQQFRWIDYSETLYSLYIIESPWISRSFLFMALPFLILGHLLAQNRKYTILRINLLISISLILLIAESYLHYHLNANKSLDFLLAIFPLSVLLFIKAQQMQWGFFKTNQLSKIAAGIYFIHPLFIHYINHWNLNPGILFILITVFSIGAAFILHQLNRWIKVLL